MNTRSRRTLLAVVLPILAAAAPVGGVALTAAVEEGCNTLPSGAPILNSLPPLGICIVQAAVGDIVEIIADPAALIGVLLAACAQYGTATVEQIIAWIELALASPPALDGGTVATHKARLNKVRSAALAMQHVVVQAAVPPSASVSAPPAPATTHP
jgi:hypothetical protein